ncbi:MAG: hypothetical protein KDB82_18295 [Planctomycetes bacterium]|nr:hypothetical protein [Planctomycetota bacterium]
MASDAGLQVQPDPDFQDPEHSPDKELGAVASVPWVAIALAVHAILLLVAWFIMPTAQQAPETMVMQTSTQVISDPPMPIQEPEREVILPDESEIEREPVEDQRVQTDEDDHAEDATDSPNHDLAENPNDADSEVDSPVPNRDNSNSSVGLGPNSGGGDGPGGTGGYFRKRPYANPSGRKPQDPQTKAALEWLRDHQNREGYWSATTFGEDSTREGAKHTHNIEFVNVGKTDGDTGWEATCDVGLTGLAMLAFSGPGYDHKTSIYRRTLRQALLYLRKVQDNDGCFGDKQDDQFVYNHAICTMAVAELYGLSGDALLRPMVQRAADFILKAQNPGMGWRYGVQPAFNDTSVSGWMVLTLHTCELAGVHFDSSKCYDDAANWFETVTVDSNGYMKCGYNAPGGNNARLRSAMGEYDHNPSMDAIYVMSMLFMGKRDLNDRDIRDMAKACTEKGFLPEWTKEKIDYYYWYYASLALYQTGGPAWDRWQKAMSSTLTEHQRGYSEADRKAGLTDPKLLDEYGSWDPVGAWGAAGGRVYATAINCLTLETYYRHQRMEGKHK